MVSRRIHAGALVLAFFIGLAFAAEPPAGKLERIAVHGKSLEGNLSGDTPDRTVFVYLPSSYASKPQQRYPVLYMLHGYSISAQFQIERIDVPKSIDRAIAAGAREMIVVFPDAQTLHNGAMYSNSVTTGDWESYIARDLVAYIDSKYRTIASRDARGLAGHSMGGYGTFRIGMKYPEVFSSLYPMSSCCLSPRGVSATDAKVESIKTVKEATALERTSRTTFAASAAWAPNPKNPPLYLDLPTKDGKPDASVIARYAANAPHSMLPQYVPNLKRYRAIAMDIGLQDFLLQDNVEMDRLLTLFDIPHSYQTYEGDHVNKVGERFEKNVLPFFSQHLKN
jgi:S-formylglutathione hydrolase FrmB